ncbi:insulinase family protein [Shewanella sp. 202IG2-18]|uniref:insulinase family protein n=1 Tax=Parashewanella hymeniacidonis TaxID=2807618 RepID=UPI0019608532|nr:insulinase family protein [Parashewanella hymeniacidonis]MBM7073987.1 insulinase family protein [Parashewanella hymeniacidonis]
MRILKSSVLMLCLVLVACQNKIDFTPVSEPTLPTFQVSNGFPKIVPDWDILDKENQYLTHAHFTQNDGVVVPISVYQIVGTQENKWDIRLVGVNPTKPISNADVLVRAFRRQSLSMLAIQQDECMESISTDASYHSVTVAMKCFRPNDGHFNQLGAFWGTEFAEDIDVDTVRRNLKLNRKIQSVTGSDINLVFQQHLLGKKHPYLQVVQNRVFFENLNLEKLKKLHAQTSSMLEWHLLLKAPSQLSEAELLAIAKQVTANMDVKTRSVVQHDVNLTSPKPPKTIYFIDAPNSSNIMVRVGLRFPQYFHKGRAVSPKDEDWLNQQQSLYACNTLSGILGRGSYGRLFYDLRETRGLTYGAYAYCRNQELLRAMVLWGSASKEHSGAFLEGMLRHISLLKSEAPQQAEVDAIKLYFLGQDLISKDQDDGMGTLQLLESSSHSAKLERLGWLKRATSGSIHALSKQFLSSTPIVVVRGDADVILDDIRQKLPGWKIKEVKGE